MTDINAPCVQHTLCAHRFGLTVQAILIDLVNHHNDKVTIDQIKKILFIDSQLPKERYQWYNWEYRASNQNLPETSYPWNAWSARYAYRCQLNKMTNISIWHHMLSRGYELLPIIDNTPAPAPPSPITHILDAREFIENHLLAVCQNPIGLAEVYAPTVLRAHNWGYTLGEILFAIFADNVDADDDMHHSRTTLHNHGGVEMSMQRQGRSFTKGSGASIVEEFVGSAYFDWDEGG